MTPTTPVKLRLVFDGRGDMFDAIFAYAEQLTSALQSVTGIEASCATRRDARRGEAVDVTILQYNPFSYAHHGVAPSVPLWLLHQRLTHRTRKVVVMVHEPYVAPVKARLFPLAGLQRLQLAALTAIADLVLASTADAARRTRALGRRPAVLPVGSNLPDRNGDRATTRTAMGIAPDEPALAVFSRSLTTRQIGLVTAAVGRVAAVRPCHLLLLGAEMPVLWGLPSGVTLHRPGPLAAGDLASCLAAADIFLATYGDGVSTRRGTLAAALQHGLPTIGTTVGRSDSVLLSTDALVVVPEGRVDEFADATLRLAVDSAERSHRSTAARELYDSHFAWPAVARNLTHALRVLA